MSKTSEKFTSGSSVWGKIKSFSQMKNSTKFMVNFFCLFSVFNATTSCTDELVEEENVKNNSNVQKIEEKEESGFVLNASAFLEDNHTIGSSTAADMALQLRSCLLHEDVTRSTATVEDVYPIGFSKARTRSSESDTMAYVVDFSNGGGFAIVAADNRMANPVLACVEQGSYEECMDNDGLQFFMEQAEEYIMQNAELFEYYKDSVNADSLFFDLDATATRATYRGTYFIDYGYFDSYGPLLKTAWRQGAPYNQECPKKCSKYEPKTGCVPLAFAQVLAYWKYPTHISNTYMDWNLMLDNGKKTHDDKALNNSATKAISKLCRLLGKAFDSEYECGSTGTNTKDAWKKVASWGFKSDWDDYSYSYVKKHIVAGRPVVTRARRSLTKSHAWVTDGCRRGYQKKMAYVMSGSSFSESLVKEYNLYYLHHNWGWGGNGNGYFEANVLNPTKPDVLDAGSSSSSMNYDYTWNVNCYVIWR